jgi:hypothetical protein
MQSNQIQSSTQEEGEGGGRKEGRRNEETKEGRKGRRKGGNSSDSNSETGNIQDEPGTSHTRKQGSYHIIRGKSEELRHQPENASFAHRWVNLSIKKQLQ